MSFLELIFINIITTTNLLRKTTCKYPSLHHLKSYFREHLSIATNMFLMRRHLKNMIIFKNSSFHNIWLNKENKLTVLDLKSFRYVKVFTLNASKQISCFTLIFTLKILTLFSQNNRLKKKEVWNLRDVMFGVLKPLEYFSTKCKIFFYRYFPICLIMI